MYFCFVLAFIKSDRPNKYPNLTIRYVRGLDPLIKLMDNSGNVQEVINKINLIVLHTQINNNRNKSVNLII